MPLPVSIRNLITIALSYLKFALVIFWALFGLYFGVGGWVKADTDQILESASRAVAAGQTVEFRGIEYTNVQQLRADLEAEKAVRLFPWIEAWPRFATLSLTAVAFGALGGLVRILKRITDGNLQDIELEDVAAWPLFGSLMGMIALGASYVVPTMLIAAESYSPRPTSLFALSMIAGMFSERVHDWMHSWILRTFVSPAGTGTSDT